MNITELNPLTHADLIDLSLELYPRMGVPPALAAHENFLEFWTVLNNKDNGLQSGVLKTPIHCGTHLDAPRHVSDDGPTIAELDVSRFITPAYCLDLPGIEARQPITREHVERADAEVEAGMALLLHTGWMEKTSLSEEYFTQSPYLTDEAAQWFADKRLNLIGYDFFQEDGAKEVKIDPARFSTHRIMLNNDVLNLEHLWNVSKVAGKHFLLICLPLKLRGSDGSGTRAVALVPRQ